MIVDANTPLSKMLSWREREELKDKLRQERLKAQDKRTPEQQLAILDERLGKDVGAKKERAQLKQEIADRG